MKTTSSLLALALLAAIGGGGCSKPTRVSAPLNVRTIAAQSLDTLGHEAGPAFLGIVRGDSETSLSFKVSGQISSLLPPPAPTLGAPGVNAAVLMLLNRDPVAPDDGGTRAAGTVPLVPVTGQFELANVLPGSYELFARVSDPSVASVVRSALAGSTSRASSSSPRLMP